jgi:hypothetical protein
VVFADVDGETVLLDPRSGSYFALDEVGSRIWSLMGRGAILGDVCHALVAEYDVSERTLEGDVVRLVGELAAAGLVLVEAQSDESSAPGRE